MSARTAVCSEPTAATRKDNASDNRYAVFLIPIVSSRNVPRSDFGTTIAKSRPVDFALNRDVPSRAEHKLSPLARDRRPCRKFRNGEGPKPTTQQAAADDNRERASKLGAGNDFLFQHLREVVIDHQNGVFAGTNDNVEKLGGRPPMTLEEFITQHRNAFE
jgi:hypothetical protein